MDWATLPKELLTTIFSFLKCADLTSVVCVNSTWHTFADYNNIWREAILNDSFPHHYSTSQKNVPWRQIAKKHFETKRNIIKKRCVQHTLGTRCPTTQRNTTIVLATKTANAKHCMLIWDMIEVQGYSYQNNTRLATELWDLETRTIISNHTSPQLELFNDFVVKAALQNYNNDGQCVSQTFYSKFDPDENDITPKKVISIETTNYAYLSATYNEDPNSSLVAFHWSNWNEKELFLSVYDLRTGEKILEKKFQNADNLVVVDFYGDKLLLRYHNVIPVKTLDLHSNQIHLLVLDVLRNTEVSILVESLCATMAGDKVWAATTGGLVKYDMQTKEQIEYKLSETIGSITSIRVYDGLLWLSVYGTRMSIADVSSKSTTAQILTQITLPGWDKPTVTPLANGTFACLATSYAHILSFKDEDIELPIEVLQFEPNGKNEILRIAQGDLNNIVLEYSSTAVSSQIVFEDKTQRYCVIYTFDTTLKDKGVNQFVEKAKKKWIAKPEYHKTAIFQLVHFNSSHCKTVDALTPVALGRAWVIYETKVNGTWQRAAPLDHWKFFKSKLKLK